jgi:photosystem II stability/assembly factor-like uncharacterized protein
MRSSVYALPRFGRPAAVFALFASLGGCLTPTQGPCVAGPAPASSAPPVEAGGPVAASSSSSPPRSVPYQWKSVVVMGGGFVTGLVYSRVEPGILYARTDIGGAYRYDAKDRSWVPLTDFLSKADSNYMGIESIAVDPVRANRVYMATGMYTQSWAGNGAFMRSDDRGDNWRVIPSTLKMGGNELGRSDGERLAVDPRQPKILYFGSRRDGLWKSVDEAETWSKVASFPITADEKGLGIPFVLFDPTSGKDGEPTPIIYAGVSRQDVGLHRSTDAGKTWKAVPKQPTGLVPSRAVFDHDGVLYVSYGLGDSPYAIQNGAVHRYDPKKDSWTDITPLKPTDQDRFGYGGVTVDPSRPGTLLAATMDRWTKGGELFRSVDGGKTWKALMAKAVLESSVAHPYHHRKKLDPPQWVGDVKINPFDPNRAMLIEGGGIWATDDLTAADTDKPTHWSFHTKNLEETAIRDLVSPPEGPPLFSIMGDLCGMRHDRLDVSPERGKFENPACASGDDIDLAYKKPNVLARVGTYPWDAKKSPRGAVSTDGGITWKQFGSEPAGSAGSGSIAVSADGAVVLWAPRDARAAYSRDGGARWVTAAGLPEPVKVPDWGPWFLRLAADRVNPKKFYALDALKGEVYVSADGGARFAVAARNMTAVPDYDLTYASLQTAPGYEGDAWITTKKDLVHSTDSGKTWTAIANVEQAYALGFGRAAPGRKYPALYFSGKMGGVDAFFRSDDGGESFLRINDDKHQYGGSHVITGDPRVYGRVYLGPPGRGIVYGEPK